MLGFNSSASVTRFNDRQKTNKQKNPTKHESGKGDGQHFSVFQLVVLVEAQLH